MRKKRDLFDEMIEGFDALADHRTGKRTLRTHALKAKPALKITAGELAKGSTGHESFARAFCTILAHECADA